MKILIADAKTMRITKKSDNQPLFYNVTADLLNYIKNNNINLEKLYKSKDIDKYKELNSKYNEQKTIAIESFNGLVYKNIDYFNLNKKQKEYINNNLLILSGLYFILRPLDSINLYRIEMSFLQNFYKDLYYNYFKDEFIINLLSNEYSFFINDNMNVINIHFLDNGKKISTYQKINRGLFVKEMAKSNIINKEDLKKITFNGYTYNKELSNNKNFYYTK